MEGTLLLVVSFVGFIYLFIDCCFFLFVDEEMWLIFCFCFSLVPVTHRLYFVIFARGESEELLCILCIRFLVYLIATLFNLIIGYYQFTTMLTINIFDPLQLC
jgi:hypothetical protein